MVTDPDDVSLRIALGFGRTWQAHRMEAKALQGCLSIERQNIEYQVGGRKSRDVRPADRLLGVADGSGACGEVGHGIGNRIKSQ
jgi:hypothetical protein